MIHMEHSLKANLTQVTSHTSLQRSIQVLLLQQERAIGLSIKGWWYYVNGNCQHATASLTLPVIHVSAKQCAD